MDPSPISPSPLRPSAFYPPAPRTFHFSFGSRGHTLDFGFGGSDPPAQYPSRGRYGFPYFLPGVSKGCSGSPGNCPAWGVEFPSGLVLFDFGPPSVKPHFHFLRVSVLHFTHGKCLLLIPRRRAPSRGLSRYFCPGDKPRAPSFLSRPRRPWSDSFLPSILVHQDELGYRGPAGRARSRDPAVTRFQFPASQAFPQDFGLVRRGVIAVIPFHRGGRLERHFGLPVPGPHQ